MLFQTLFLSQLPKNPKYIIRHHNFIIIPIAAENVVAYPKEKFPLIGTKSFLDFVRPLERR